MNSGSDAFKPVWWLPEGHSQTLWRKFSPSAPVCHRRERIELDDGDFIDLDWAVADCEWRTDTVVVIIHGLCGCSASSYVQSLQSTLTEQAIPSVAMNFRGCSGEVNRLAKAYHSGISDDLDQVFSYLGQRYSDRSFALVGYSLGANVLLKWLGETGRHEQLRRAVAVSTPFSLAACSRAMLAGLSRVYGYYFVRRLVAAMNTKKASFRSAGNEKQLRQLEQLGTLDNIRTIWEFDDRVTAPLHGFADAEDYYRRCSSLDYLARIEADTLLIQSANDPMIPAAALPQAAQLPSHIHFQLHESGGHVGFMAGFRDDWLERRIVNFLSLGS